MFLLPPPRGRPCFEAFVALNRPQPISEESAGSSIRDAAKFKRRSGGSSVDSGKARASPAFAR